MKSRSAAKICRKRTLLETNTDLKRSRITTHAALEAIVAPTKNVPVHTRTRAESPCVEIDMEEKRTAADKKPVP